MPWKMEYVPNKVKFWLSFKICFKISRVFSFDTSHKKLFIPTIKACFSNLSLITCFKEKSDSLMILHCFYLLVYFDLDR